MLWEKTFDMKNALILAGGGVAGIAWELGVLRGLQDSGPGWREETEQLKPGRVYVITAEVAALWE